MTLSIMFYGVALGLLLSMAAHFLDSGLRGLHRPTRWIWAPAMAATAILPPLSVLVPRGPPAAAPSGTAMALESLYGLWEGVALPGPLEASLPGGLNGYLLLAWIAASCLVLLLFAVAALRLRKSSARWPRASAGGEEFLVSDGLGPAVLGLLNPRIVLPPWAFSLESTELEMVLLHEAEHRRARDPALLAVGILLVALSPWNPTLWWCLRRLRLAVEGDCDGRVLAHGVHPARYGSLILGVASGARGFFPLAPALAEGGGTFLERRLKMMRNGVGKRRIGRAAGAAAVGGLFLALACETPTPPQSPVLGADAEAAVQFEEQAEAQLELTKENAARANGDSPVAGILKLRPTGEDGEQAPPLIYVDGVRLEGGKLALAELDPDEIDRIEVVKGAAAEAVWGPEASAGVIQIFLKKK